MIILLVENMPNDLIESFCGVGNPFTLGSINSGETVLDVGCGELISLLQVARLGRSGESGIDLTPEMAEKAKNNLRRYGVQNYDVRVAGASLFRIPTTPLMW